MKSTARLTRWLLDPPVAGHPATLLPRLMAGGAFLWELYLVIVGPGRWSLDARVRRARGRALHPTVVGPALEPAA
jgi:hypothetical protein